jgi:hypothetical protein
MNQNIRFVFVLFATFVSCGQAVAQGLCGEWVMVAPPAGTSTIREVTATSSTDAWAINDDLNFDGVIHWNGATWSNVPLPDLSSYGQTTVFHSTTSLAVGHFFVAGVVTTSAFTSEQLLLTWDGSGWDRVATVELVPDIAGAGRHGTPHSIVGVAPDDLWLIGSAWDMGTGTGTGLVLTVHWDGSQLTEHLTAGVGNRQNHLYDADAVAADDIWAVGKYNNTGLDDYTFHGMIYHYDGTAWSHVPSPANDIDSSRLYAVAAIASDDVWAAGSDLDGPLFMHWDGSSWAVVPEPPGATGTIQKLAAIASDDVWAVDYSYPIGDYYHWDGSSWSTETADIPGATIVARHGGLAAAGSCDVWAVGNVNFGQGPVPFIERLQVGGAPAAVPVTSSSLGSIDVQPNPLGDFTEIRFAAGGDVPVRAEIYDVRGQLVRTLLFSTFPGSLSWDGRDELGQAVASGVYFLKVASEDGIAVTRKLTVLR